MRRLFVRYLFAAGAGFEDVAKAREQSLKAYIELVELFLMSLYEFPELEQGIVLISDAGFEFNQAPFEFWIHISE